MARRKSPRRRPAVEGLERRALLAANVTTYRYDDSGDGLNPAETTLNPADVNASGFGRLFASGLDGYAFAEPLYVAGVDITAGASQGTHDVVYVATEHDSVYAIDAESGAVLWKDSLLDAVHGGTVSTVPTGALNNNNLGPEEGITSTPVIDTSTGTLYVVAETQEVVGGVDHYIQQLHALDLGSGAEKFVSPAVIADTVFDGANYTYVSGPSVVGNGFGSVGGVDFYNALRQSQRAALAENDGTIYVASASQGDYPPYHGWILGYNAETLQLTVNFNTTPNGADGGIWVGGGGLAFDAQGDLFVTTGNGTFDGSNGSDPNADAGGPGPITGLDAQGFPVDGDYGSSVLKLVPDPASSPAHPNLNGWGLKVADYFTPVQQSYLSASDKDFGSQEALLLPASDGSAAHPNLVVVSDKEGTLYLLDRDNLGRFGTTTDAAVQELKGAFPNGSFTSPAAFDGLFYYATPLGHLQPFTVADAAFAPATGEESPDTFTHLGAPPSISSDGTIDGIVWVLDHDTSQLRAYDATDPADELYTSAQAPGGQDALVGDVTEFSTPTVVDGRVYVATASGLVAFGLLPAGGRPTVPVLPSSPVLPTTANPAPFGTDNPDVPTAEVTGLYHLILGRAPDAPGLATAVNTLKDGVSLAAVASAFLGSAEYESDVVASYYKTFLDRSASPSEVAAWVALMQQGLTEEQVVADFFDSAEYGHLHPADSDFVASLYADLLGRQGSAPDVAAWVSAVGAVGRPAVVNDFLRSTEAETWAVNGLYEVVLGRPGDPAGVSFYVAGLRGSASLVDVAIALAGSAEFVQRASATVG